MQRPLLLAALLLGVSALFGAGATRTRAEEEGAAERARKAASLEVTWEQRDEHHVVRQYEVGYLGQWSYLLGSGGEAVVVDPQREVERYLLDAEALGLRITKVVLTRTHTDFVAGHSELLARTGAVVLVGPESRAGFEHETVAEPRTVELGALQLEVRPAPGPTADGLAVYVTVKVPGADAPGPRYVLTGDALLVGAVGVPDVVVSSEPPSVTAALAFDTLHVFGLLPDEAIVLPGHDAAARSGAPPSPTTTSTIGREKEANPYGLIDSRARFVARLLRELPPHYQHAAHVARLNREGPPLLVQPLPAPPRVDLDAPFPTAATGACILDLHAPDLYAQGHPSGAINAPLAGPFETWVGAVVPPGAALYVRGDETDVTECVRRLARIGYEHAVKGWLDEVPPRWEALGRAATRSAWLSVADLVRLRSAWLDPLLVDVRGPAEYAEGHIEDSVNVPLPDLERLTGLFGRKTPLLFVCQTAYRSTIAVGVAESLGFENVGVLDGGLKAWRKAQQPVTR